MRILVTGATGYIGRPVTALLAAEGHHVLALTRDPSSARSTAFERIGVRPVAGDIGDPSSYAPYLAEVDAVVHAVVDADDPVRSDEALFAAVRAADDADRGRRHVVYTTGCSTYGDAAHTVLTEATPVDPDHPRAMLEAALVDSGLAHTVIRPAMVHGGDARSSIVGRWFAEAEDGRAVHHGDPGKLWSWVHTDDLATAYAAVLAEPAAHAGQVYLVADDQAVPALTVLTEAARVAGHDGPVSFAPIEEESLVYRVFDHDVVIDATRARTLLGWTPRHGSVLAELPASFAAWSRG